MQRIHLLGLAMLAACAPANVAGGKTAAATGGTAGGTPVPADAPMTGSSNNPTPTSIGSSPTGDHPADSTGHRPAAAQDTVRSH
jgi:hypothetical protein